MPIRTAEDYGSLAGANAAPAINAQITAEGRFILPPGDFKVQDSILPGKHGGASYGAGKEVSRLIANGMAGTSVFKASNPNAYIRHDYHDFGVVGDGTVVDGVTSACDHAMDWTLGSGRLVYQSSFRNLNLSGLGSAFKAPSAFSITLDRVDTWSVDGHGFEMGGGNTTLLQGCYAHKVGTGKAGYRIRTSATLVSCNGLDADNDCMWGHFGDNGPSKAVYQITLVGCNVEDFGSVGIGLEYTGHITFHRTGFLARSTGTYECAVKALNGSPHYLEFNIGSGAGSKGATRTAAREIVSAGGSMNIRVHARTSPDVFREYVSAAGLVHRNAEDAVKYTSYLTNTLELNL